MLGFILGLGQKRRHGGQLFKLLRQRGKRRSRSSGKDLRGFIPNRVRISQRPQRANLRSRVGDWESDPVSVG